MGSQWTIDHVAGWIEARRACRTFNQVLNIAVVRLREMEMLVRVAEAGSMTLAARQLHMTPAAVSAAIQRVEDALRLRVFERTTRTLHPTDDGLVVLEGCQAVLDRWQQTLDAAQGPGAAPAGTVHLSAPSDTTYRILEPVLSALSTEHAGLRVVVHSSDAVQHLHRDAIDLAIRYGPLRDSTLTARKLVDTPNILVAAPAYLDAHGAPESPAALVTRRCLTLRRAGVPMTAWTLDGPGGEVTVPIDSPLCGDGHLCRRWALAGLGITMKSLFDVIDDIESGRLVRVLPGSTGRGGAIHAVFPSRRFLPARVRVVDAAITAAFDERARRCDAWLAQHS